MPKVKTRKGQVVDLQQQHYKTSGGEGDIYIIGDIVYKVCFPGRMIPQKKFEELAVLDHPAIIRPLDVLYEGKNPTGYTMRSVPGNARTLASILTKSFRDRENVSHSDMLQLVSQIAAGLRFIHSKGHYLQVDGNERNYMVAEKFDEIYFIDVNSYETPSFPADAIMPNIRDYSVVPDVTGRHRWTQLSDWYSFAIISWYMFTAIHPFMGRHPSFTNAKTSMIDQMKAGISVLNPEVTFPLGAVYHPFENFIPGGASGAWYRWYKAIFTEGKRLPAPTDFQAVATLVTAIRQITGSDRFDIRQLNDYLAQVIGFYEQGGREVVVTKNAVHIGSTRYERPADRFRIGFTPSSRVMALYLENGQCRLKDVANDTLIPFGLTSADDIMSYNGRLYAKAEGNFYEITFMETGGSVFAVPKHLANLLPNATTVYQGCAVMDFFGAKLLSLFPQAGQHQQIKLAELEKYRITEAKFENGVLMVVGMRAEGGYDRLVFRFNPQYQYDLRVIENITPTGINFTVLPNGICVCLNEEEKIEIFSSTKDSPHIKVYDDPVIESNMRLCHAGSQVRFAKDSRLFSIAVK